jgi:hypothetical protein
MTMKKGMKLSATQQWLADHPDDVPCPRDPNLAGVWRRKRGLEATASRRRITAIREKYELAMAKQAPPAVTDAVADRAARRR